MNAPQNKRRSERKFLSSLKSLEDVEAIVRRFLRVLEHASQSLKQKKNRN
jgi:hypothetical protein